MRLLKRVSRVRTGSAKALHKPRQCIEARRDVAHAGEPGVLLERRHPGGVVEASAVGRDERRNHHLYRTRSGRFVTAGPNLPPRGDV
jgi:hypothetical protein